MNSSKPKSVDEFSGYLVRLYEILDTMMEMNDVANRRILWLANHFGLQLKEVDELLRDTENVREQLYKWKAELPD